jgi:hypothetical protein
MPVVSQAYGHSLQHHHHGPGSHTQSHFTQLNSFQQHSSILHHPQPLSFGPLLHPTPILATPQLTSPATSLASSVKFEQTKITGNFEFNSLNSSFYKPLNHLQQLSPTNSKSTISIDSSIGSGSSERIVSPHSTVDSHCGNNLTPPPIIDVKPQSAAITVSNCSSSPSSATAVHCNGNSIQESAPNFPSADSHTVAQNGLLDILMSPAKCQVHWYEILLPKNCIIN